MTQKQHIPVLGDEVLSVLHPARGEKYLDLTAGFGGHADSVIKLIGLAGQAWLFDRDAQAIAALHERFSGQDNVKIVRENFAQIDWRGMPQADMILLDLGVSSAQLDQVDRGFTFREDASLDMRMDDRQTTTAADLVNTLEEAQLADIIFRYGEERRSRMIARKIVAIRTELPIMTTQQLAEIVRSVVPSGRIDGATKTFQALRIAVNGELDALEAVLPEAINQLAPGGRLAVISFHSLEDRIVKHFMRDKTQPVWDTITGQPLQESLFTLVTKKPLMAATEEIAYNPRARSAKLRAVEKKK
ncbi:MAG: 16S rRNA (cytosine(1402)-N(4))-methyltransferase RsmH [Candidatus Saccharibacteria bacterium]